MAVLLSTKPEAMAEWEAALSALDPSLVLYRHPFVGDPAEIEAVVMWTGHDLADLRRYPNLRLLVSMGAGVDHLLAPPGPPPGCAGGAAGGCAPHPGDERMGAAESVAVPPPGSGISCPAGGAHLAGIAAARHRPGGGSACWGWARLAPMRRASSPISASRSPAGRGGRRRCRVLPATTGRRACRRCCGRRTSWFACCRLRRPRAAFLMRALSLCCRAGPMC